MRKRILLAEQSDAVRGAAETALRQNGFEVISVAAAERALEVLQFTRPHLLIVGEDLSIGNQGPLYEKIHDDPKTNTIPMLVLDGSEGGLPLAQEAVIRKPFDAGQFLERVKQVSGPGDEAKKQKVANPLGEAELDDDFLNAALGIDKLDVTDSEVMDKTTSGARSTRSKSTDKFVGLDHHEKEQEEVTDTGKVESVMIRDGDATDIRRSAEREPQPTTPSGTGKLEILSNQYALSDPNALKAEAEDRVHDYEWFIGEMRMESEASPAEQGPAMDEPPEDTPASDLSVSEPMSMVDPITPPPYSSAPVDAPGQGTTDGVDKFLDEFRKEVERLQSDTPDEVKVGDDRPPGSSSAAGERLWQDSVEKISREQISPFTRRLCSELAEKIAKKIVAKIDSEALIGLLKDEILSNARGSRKSGGQDS